MNQQELEELLRQIAPNGQPERLEFHESTETAEVEEPDPYGGPTPVKVKRPVKTLTWIDRGTGQTLAVQVNPRDGTYTKISQGPDPKMQGQPATTPAQQQADETGVAVGTREDRDKNGNVTKITTYRRPDGSTYERTDTVTVAPAEGSDTKPLEGYPGWGVKTTKVGNDTRTVFVNPAGQEAPDPRPQANQPGRSERNVTINGKNLIEVTTTDPATNSKRTFTIDPVTRQEVQAPKDPGQIVWRDGRPYQITTNDAGEPVIKPVTRESSIQMADFPVLQAQYGQIAEGLGRIAQDLNGRYSRGEITREEWQQAFQVAHQQASTQVEEINSILSNSRSTWAQQVAQRGQTLGEAQSRRAYAANVLGHAVSTGDTIARSAGPGHGAAIAGGVSALLGMGQRYAEGMGGFRESPEVQMPLALQQQQQVGLPGFGPPGGPQASPSGGPTPSNALGLGAIGNQPAPGGAAPPNPAAAPRPWTDANTGPSVLRPGVGGPAGPGAQPPMQTLPFTGPAPAPQTLPFTGPTPAPSLLGGPQGNLGTVGAQLMQALSFGGSPVAAGGLGVYDPLADSQSMLSANGSDPTWDEAVRRAAADMQQGPRGAYQPSSLQQGYRRFG